MTKHTRFLAEDAIDYSDLEFPTRHLLRTMWSRADAKTGIIPRPISLDELAARTGMSRASVKRHLNKAEEGEWLLKWSPSTKAAITRHEKNKYQMLLPQWAHSEPEQGSERATVINTSIQNDLTTPVTMVTDPCFVCMKNERDPMFLGKPLCFECATS